MTAPVYSPATGSAVAAFRKVARLEQWLREAELDLKAALVGVPEEERGSYVAETNLIEQSFEGRSRGRP